VAQAGQVQFWMSSRIDGILSFLRQQGHFGSPPLTWLTDGSGDRVSVHRSRRRHVLEAHSMETTKSRSSSKIITFLSILLAVLLVAGCAPRVTGTIDVPVGDDLATTVVEGTVLSPYGDTVALSILKGEGKYPSDFSVTMKVLEVLDTRSVRGEIMPPIPFEELQPGNTIFLYLCTPLSEKADKLSDGTIVYKGDGYPQIVVGRLYDVTGVLQPGWQDYPLVYIPTASQVKQASSGN